MANVNPDQTTETTIKTGLAPDRRDTIDAVDNADLESDTGSDVDINALTTSITSSVYDYVYENGRRYHRFREGAYFMPNDQAEQDRLDMLHHIFTMILGGRLFRAPIDERSPIVLDIGTGTGLWAIEMAEQYPGSTVLGTDLSPIQPEWVPSNCSFMVDDVEAPWSFEEIRSFDYIHQRNMVGSIADWGKLFSEALRSLSSGGWYEAQEFAVWFHSQDGPLPEDSALNIWQHHLEHCSQLFGKRLNIAEDLEEPFKNAGFVDVKHDVHKVSIIVSCDNLLLT